MSARLIIKSAKQIIVALSLISLTAIIFAACGPNESGSQNTSPVSPTSRPTTESSSGYQVVHISPSYVNWYTDLKSLKQDADVVVEGTITKVNPSVQDKPYARTTSVFSINQVLSNPKNLVQPSTNIIITQVGGVIGNTVYKVEDNPLFKEGEQAILFLNVDTTGTLYYVIGGPSGRFTIQNDQIIPTTNQGLKFTTPKSAAQFVAEIKAQPLEPKPVPTFTPVPPTPKVQPRQAVNLSQLYSLDKAQTILLKAGPKSTTIRDAGRIKAIATSLDKTLIALNKTANSGSASADQQLIYLVFTFADGKTVSLEYNSATSILVSNPPDSIIVTVPANFLQTLDLA